MKKIDFLLFCFILLANATSAQKIIIVDSSQSATFRGMSIVDQKIAWVSGSNGTIGKTTDGGQHWEWIRPKGFENTDFRSIKAYSAQEAIIVGIASPAYILKTSDGGSHWNIVYQDNDSLAFLDAMIGNQHSLFVIGDPIANKAYFLTSNNKGKHWKRDVNYFPKIKQGEAFFASSSSNIATLGKQIIAVTGGKSANILFPNVTKNNIISLPLTQGNESAGAHSVATFSENKKQAKICVVGGDYIDAKNTVVKNIALYAYNNSELKPLKVEQPPFGYKSSVIYLNANKLVTTGYSGTDISEDGGIHWKHISDISFNIVQANGNLILLAGGKGKIAQLEW